MGYADGLKDDFRKDGYSREEEFFHRLNRELLENYRRQLGREGRGPGDARLTRGRGTVSDSARAEPRSRPRGLWERIRQRLFSVDTGWKP